MANCTVPLQCVTLFTRFEGNPILKPEIWPYHVNSVFNPGAVRYNNETALLNRVEGCDGFSHLTLARSKDGMHDWKIDPEPTLYPEPDLFPEELWGVEDPRIVYLKEIKSYAVLYTAYSSGGPLVSLAMTRDFKEFRKQGSIMPPDDKDACLFPRKFNGRWALIHRPMPANPMAKANIWISFSPDLKHWGDHSILLEARDGGWWDSRKIGLGPQPVETPEGWLIMYHGVRVTASGSIYRVGLALLDLDNPLKVICRSRFWVFGPREAYERIGDVAGVTFPSGLVYDAGTDNLFMYYGAADSTVALATARLKDVLDFLKETSTQ